MTERADLDRTFAAWLHGEAPPTPPDDLLSPVFAVTSTSRPMPTWRALLGVRPMRTQSTVLVGSPTLSLARVLVALVLILGLVAAALGVAGAFRSANRDAPRDWDAPPPTGVKYVSETFPRYRLTLGDIGTGVRWGLAEDLDASVEHFSATRSDGPKDFIGHLTIERPAEVFDTKGWISAPDDLVDWLRQHPNIQVSDVLPVSLGGLEAIAVDALPVRTTPPQARPGEPGLWDDHFAKLLPALTLDFAWRYRFVVLTEPGRAGPFVATCGALPENWTDASRACSELLATIDDPPAGYGVFVAGQPAPPLVGSFSDGRRFDLRELADRPAVVLQPGDYGCASELADDFAAARRLVGDRATFVILEWPPGHCTGAGGDVRLLPSGVYLMGVNEARAWDALWRPHADWRWQATGSGMRTAIVVIDAAGVVNRVISDELPGPVDLAALLEPLIGTGG